MPPPLIGAGIGAGVGALGSAFGPSEQTTTSGLSPEAMRMLAPYRQGALAAGFGQADPMSFFNPFIPQQVEALRSEAQRFLPQALGQIAGQSTLQGGGGGTREAAFQGAAAGGIGSGLLSSIANLQAGGFQSALQAALADAQRRGQLGTFGLPMQQTTPIHRNPFAGALGGASLGFGMFGGGGGGVPGGGSFANQLPYGGQLQFGY